MMYYTVYDYKIKGRSNIVYPDNNACFGTLMHDLRNIPEISITRLRCYLIRDIKHIQNHDFRYSIETLQRIIKTFDNFLEMPTISLGVVGDIPRIDRYHALGGFYKNEMAILEFDFKEKTHGYIKFAVTLCRYFYENQESSANYLEIMDRYLECLDIPEYDHIPRIELLQLVHSRKNCASGHGFFSSCANWDITPIEEEKFLERINNPSYTFLNGSLYALFHGVGDTRGPEDKDFKKAIQKYENNRTRSESIC